MLNDRKSRPEIERFRQKLLRSINQTDDRNKMKPSLSDNEEKIERLFRQRTGIANI